MSLAPESLSILIVESDEKDREDLKGRLLAAPGWSLTIGEARDTGAALEALKKGSIDLVFLARRLPDGESQPLLDRIRQLHPKSAVIVTCAQADAAWAVSAMKKGALDCLPRADLPRIDFGPILGRLVETRNLVNQNMELRQVNQMKNEFIANVSHELRTPLTVVIGYARSLQDGTLGDLTSEQRKAVDSIVGRSEELLATLNHILRAREVNAGRQLATLKPTDLRELWRSCTEKAAKDLERKRLRLETALPQSPVWVMADAAAFADVCTNLLSNAVKFSPEGGTVQLAVGASSDRAWAMLRDQGPGIPPEILPRIFEDFSTASTSGPTRQRGGLGLGRTKGHAGRQGQRQIDRGGRFADAALAAGHGDDVLDAGNQLDALLHRMRDYLRIDVGADVADAGDGLQLRNHRGTQSLDLALGRIAELDVERNIAAADLDVLDAAAADEILAGIGVDDGLERILDALFVDGHERPLRVTNWWKEILRSRIIAGNRESILE